MMSFLITISFILHVITFFSIVLLVMRIGRLKEGEAKHEQQKREMEELLSSYLMELQEENEKFLNILKKSEHTSDKVNLQPAQKETTKKENHIYKPPKVKANTKPIGKGQADKKIVNDNPIIQDSLYVPPQPEGNVNDRYAPSLESNVLLLQKQGLSIEEIAKKLNKGKTEIELLLKFRQ